MRKYNPENWSNGDRVRINPNYSWSYPKSIKDLEKEGTVESVSPTRLHIRWDNSDLLSNFTHADISLIKIEKVFQGLPDELFEI